MHRPRAEPAAFCLPGRRTTTELPISSNVFQIHGPQAEASLLRKERRWKDGQTLKATLPSQELSYPTTHSQIRVCFRDPHFCFVFFSWLFVVIGSLLFCICYAVFVTKFTQTFQLFLLLRSLVRLKECCFPTALPRNMFTLLR